jgi:predicted  nucleic acid-binding Zn-ribbon protein
VLGYQKKLIKNQEVQLRKATSELDTARKAAETANAAAAELEQKKKTASDLLDEIQQNAKSSSSVAEQIRDAGTKTATMFNAIQQQEQQGGELTSNIRTTSNEMTALDASIRKFYGEVGDYRNRINQTTEDAAAVIRSSEGAVKKLVDDTKAAAESSPEAASKAHEATTQKLQETITENANQSELAFTKLSQEIQSNMKAVLEKVEIDAETINSASQAKVEELERELVERSEKTIGANQKRTEDLIHQLEQLKEQIGEQIQQATGFQLFGAFQSRQNEIAQSKRIWVWAIGLLVLVSAGVTVWIAHEAQYYSVNSFAFWIKLSLTVPVGFALTFCTVQYSRERRLCSAPLKTRRSGSPSLGQLQKPRRPRAEYDF